MSAASRAINGDPIVKQAGLAILSIGGGAGSILTIRISGQIPSFPGTLVPGLPGNFTVPAMATFRQRVGDENLERSTRFFDDLLGSFFGFVMIPIMALGIELGRYFYDRAEIAKATDAAALAGATETSQWLFEDSSTGCDHFRGWICPNPCSYKINFTPS